VCIFPSYFPLGVSFLRFEMIEEIAIRAAKVIITGRSKKNHERPPRPTEHRYWRRAVQTPTDKILIICALPDTPCVTIPRRVSIPNTR
jgi:hypothetical protein